MGRATRVNNPDGSYTESQYNACGCAGGDTTTVYDERRRSKSYTKDALGRLTEVIERNFDTTPYAWTNYSYNALDQMVSINQAGLWRAFRYDGHGRLKERDTPEQGVTSYTYFNNDLTKKVTDARGATQTFAYNNRNLVTGITYGVPAGVAATPAVSFGYDSVGNRTSMNDGQGRTVYNYNALSQLEWEERYFNGIGGGATPFRLSYEYNLQGQLTKITNPWNIVVGYTRNSVGEVTGVTARITPACHLMSPVSATAPRAPRRASPMATRVR
ncbi:MAG: hypothetical protein WKF84_24835 [Pyrinomonadaceae bacterium]